MAHSTAPIALRTRRAALVLTALLAALTVGCGHHKRTSLRPVYVTPARPVSPCPSGDCGGSVGTVAPSSPSTSSSVDPSVIESGSTTSSPTTGSGLPEPALGPSPSATIVRPPTPSARPSDTPPPVTGPSMPGFPDEPDLTPVPSGKSSNVPSTRGSSPATGGGSGSNSGGGTVPPSASFYNGNSRRTSTGRVRPASLRDNVSLYVDDPGSLFSPPKADRPWKYIVLHHSASATGGYDSIDQEHRQRLGWQGCGYHFVIGNGTESPDGKIEVARRWVDQKHGVHCRDARSPDVSEYGIGICLVGDLEKSPPTDRQIAAARALVAYLGDRYQIPADHTETHAHLAASPTSCPGRLFPTQAILKPKSLTLR